MAIAPRFALFRLLDGLVTLYKPPNISVEKLTRYMKRILSEDFNALPGEHSEIRTIIRSSGQDPTAMTVVSVPDLVQSKLVLGRTFLPGDFMIHAIDPLADMASGVQVLGIGENGALQQATKFERFSWLKTYHLTGMLGRASVDGTPFSATLLRSSWRHVTRQKLDRVLAGMQAQFRSSALLQAGLRPNTQTTYLSLAGRTENKELRALTATKLLPDLQEREHLLPPWERSRSLGARSSGVQTDDRHLDENQRRELAPCVYSIRCVHFDPPYFTVELQVSCETLSFLIDLVTNLGPRLRSSSLLTQARRIRHGRITTEETMLLKHCRVPTSLAERLNDYVIRELDNDRYDHEQIDSSDQSKILDYLATQSTPNVFTNLRVCSRLGVDDTDHEADHHLVSSST